MKQVELCGQMVRIDNEGLISLTDMWRASGSESKHQVSKFLENDATKRLIKRLEQNTGNPVLRISKGRYGGSWAAKFIAQEYAVWVDTDFKIGVHEILDQYFSGQLKPATSPMDQLNAVVLKERTSLAKAKVASEWMHDRKREKKKLADEEKKAIDELQQSLDLLNFVGPKLLVKK